MHRRLAGSARRWRKNGPAGASRKQQVHPTAGRGRQGFPKCPGTGPHRPLMSARLFSLVFFLRIHAPNPIAETCPLFVAIHVAVRGPRLGRAERDGLRGGVTGRIAGEEAFRRRIQSPGDHRNCGARPWPSGSCPLPEPFGPMNGPETSRAPCPCRTLSAARVRVTVIPPASTPARPSGARSHRGDARPRGRRGRAGPLP